MTSVRRSCDSARTLGPRASGIALAVILGMAAPAAAADTLGVAEVVAGRTALDGQVILVRGWVDSCARRSCAPFPTLAAAAAKGSTPPFLSIAASPLIDERVAPLAHAEIILRARFDSRCLGADPAGPKPKTLVVCTDRASVLDPIAVVAVVTPSSLVSHPTSGAR